MHPLLADNLYINDILHQPEALGDTLSALSPRPDDRIDRLADRLGDGSLKRLILTGMGSSYHALHPLRLTLIERGLYPEMFETSELIHFAPRALTPETLIIAVSQSGYSAEILRLLELTKGSVPVLGVTNTPDSPLAHKAEALMTTQAGNEATVSCKTYLATLAALTVLGDLLTHQDPQPTFLELEAAVEATSAYLSRWENYLESAIESLESIRHLILTGRGPSLAAAGTGGLITKEAAHFPTEGMSSAAFRHGPFEMVSPTLLTLIFEGSGAGRALNAGLAEDICKAGGRAETVKRGTGESLYTLPEVSDTGLPILEILPVQVLTVALAVRNNHKPGVFERGKKITTTE